jgi:DNA-binding NarL/FixJ family response regulator
MTRSELDRMQDAARRLFVSPHVSRAVADGATAYNDDVVAFRELVECVRRAIQAGVRIDRALTEELRAGFDRLQEDRALLERESG